MDPDGPIGADADHHGAVGVGEDAGDVAEAKLTEPLGEVIRQAAHSPWSPPAIDTATLGAPARAKLKASEGWNRRSFDSQR